VRLLLALSLLTVLLLLAPLAAADPPATPCVSKVLSYQIVVGCRGSDGRTDALCYYVVHQAYITTEMACVDGNADGDACVTAYSSVTYDPYHFGRAVPACVPGST
jgi:hypothetical protein